MKQHKKELEDTNMIQNESSICTSQQDDEIYPLTVKVIVEA